MLLQQLRVLKKHLEKKSAIFCNADGTSKVAPIITNNFQNLVALEEKVGKYFQSWLENIVHIITCLKLPSLDLGFYKYWNKKAWMKKAIFCQIITKFNRRMIAEKRNVLLILDNATIHEQHWIYSNTKLIFLSLNTTSHCHQLNNADFIANYKEHHRKHHYKRVAHKCLPSTRRDNVDDNNQPVAGNSTHKKPHFWPNQL